MTSTDLTAAHENIKAGNLTSLGITSLKRTKLAPDLRPSRRAAYRASGPGEFHRHLSPLGTPPDKIRQISAAIAEILAKPNVQTRVSALSVEPDYEDETTFAKYLAAEATRTKELIGSLTKP